MRPLAANLQLVSAVLGMLQWCVVSLDDFPKLSSAHSIHLGGGKEGQRGSLTCMLTVLLSRKSMRLVTAYCSLRHWKRQWAPWYLVAASAGSASVFPPRQRRVGHRQQEGSRVCLPRGVDHGMRARPQLLGSERYRHVLVAVPRAVLEDGVRRRQFGKHTSRRHPAIE